jgi:hypothetical protein
VHDRDLGVGSDGRKPGSDRLGSVAPSRHCGGDGRAVPDAPLGEDHDDLVTRRAGDRDRTIHEALVAHGEELFRCTEA